MPLLRLLYQRYTFLFFCFTGLFIMACGIPSFIYLEKPQRSGHNPSNLTALNDRYCEFKTADSANTAHAAGYIKGTEIYYRIYERKNDCENDRSRIDQYNDDNPFTAAEYLENTKKYYRLAATGIYTRPLIGTYPSDASVRFRLQDYGSPASDPAQLTVNGIQQGIPQRDDRIPHAKRTFNKDNITVGDDDVQQASVSGGTETYWCVNFYAVSYGYTATFSTLHSALEYLGYILLEKKNP